MHGLRLLHLRVPGVALYLTVNRENAGSIAAYLAMGFRKVREQVTDIGEGYVMDDFIMEKAVER